MAEKSPPDRHELAARLSPLAFDVTQNAATEPAFSNDDFAHADGIFHCICCDAPLFDAAAKFQSGTGWPSFFAPLNDTALGEKSDKSWFMRRTEVHCAACHAHLGHVFADGPAPTGLRYCMNGVALRFRPSLSCSPDPQG